MKNLPFRCPANSILWSWALWSSVHLHRNCSPFKIFQIGLWESQCSPCGSCCLVDFSPKKPLAKRWFSPLNWIESKLTILAQCDHTRGGPGEIISNSPPLYQENGKHWTVLGRLPVWNGKLPQAGILFGTSSLLVSIDVGCEEPLARKSQKAYVYEFPLH